MLPPRVSSLLKREPPKETLFGIRVLDHVIHGDASYSLADTGEL
jgi:hypothetical protein